MTYTSGLAKIQAAQEKLMPETVYVQELTRTPDLAGGSSEAWATTATVKGRITQLGGNERVLSDKLGAVLTHRVTLPHDTTLEPKYRLQINGVQYMIETPLRRTEQTALQVNCVEVK